MAYASKYYDPVKAHEYYERTKQLKGRTSTKNLSNEGKSALSYVKKSINDQKKSDLKKADENLKSNLQKESSNLSEKLSSESAKTAKAIQDATDKLKSDLDSLRTEIDNSQPLSESQRSRFSKLLQRMISQNNANKQKLESAYSKRAASLKSESSATKSQLRKSTSDTKKSIRENAKSEIEKETTKILNAKDFQKVEKSKKTRRKRRS